MTSVDEWQNQKLYTMEQAIKKMARRAGVAIDLDAHYDDEDDNLWGDDDGDGIPNRWDADFINDTDEASTQAHMDPNLANLLHAVTMLNIQVASLVSNASQSNGAGTSSRQTNGHNNDHNNSQTNRMPNRTPRGSTMSAPRQNAGVRDRVSRLEADLEDLKQSYSQLQSKYISVVDSRDSLQRKLKQARTQNSSARNGRGRYEA